MAMSGGEGGAELGDGVEGGHLRASGPTSDVRAGSVEVQRVSGRAAVHWWRGIVVAD